MHMVIRAIVYATDEEEALENAKGIFKELVNNTVFDYFTTFDEEGNACSGKGRWGELPAVALASSKEGKKLINEGMEYTKEEFKRAFQLVKQDIEKEEPLKNYMEETGAVNDLFRHYCYLLGQYEGNSIWLYDQDGAGVRDEKHLKNVLEKWKCLNTEASTPRYEGLNIYVVPADVHY